jgi:hypothetical protein
MEKKIDQLKQTADRKMEEMLVLSEKLGKAFTIA